MAEIHAIETVISTDKGKAGTLKSQSWQQLIEKLTDAASGNERQAKPLDLPYKIKIPYGGSITDVAKESLRLTGRTHCSSIAIHLEALRLAEKNSALFDDMNKIAPGTALDIGPVIKFKDNGENVSEILAIHYPYQLLVKITRDPADRRITELKVTGTPDHNDFSLIRQGYTYQRRFFDNRIEFGFDPPSIAANGVVVLKRVIRGIEKMTRIIKIDRHGCLTEEVIASENEGSSCQSFP